VESALVTNLFVVSSVGLSTRGLESSSEVALESVGRSVRGCVGFTGGGGFSPLCVVCGYPSMLCNIHLRLLAAYSGIVVKSLYDATKY
jgi:hypothetical protein